MEASIYTRTWRWDSRTKRLAVELRSILHGAMGLWDCPGELKKEGRNDAVEVPEREVESSGIVGGECSVVCPRGPAGSRSSFCVIISSSGIILYYTIIPF